MKTITTLTAVAALIAGISIASAQNSTSQSTSQSPSSVNKGESRSMNSGGESKNKAMDSGKMAGQQAMAKGNGKFCLTTKKGGTAMNCKYASIAACEKDAKPVAGQCAPNKNMGTTGSGMGSKKK